MIEVIISTMNKNSISDLNLKQKNIQSNVLIINQTDNSNTEIKENERMINYKELGLSKSRNRGIENAKGDICLISDDDVEYINGFEELIINEFEKDKEADIITFCIITPENKPFKNYKSKEFYHNKRSILKVSSIEIAFRKKSVLDKKIKFDENFGLGSKYNSGEENIFLMDCLNKRLKIKYVPINIGIHPIFTSGKVLDEKSIYSKGALFYRLFGINCIYLNLVFVLKKHKIISMNLINAIINIYKGTLNYIIK